MFLGGAGQQEQIRDLKRRHSQADNKAKSRRHFQSSGTSSSGGLSSQTSALNRLFDSYRESPQDAPDAVGIDGVIKYFGHLEVSLDEPAVLAVSQVLQAPGMGELTRQGFIEGWTSLNASTLQAQKTAVASLRSNFATDRSRFKLVYRHTFILARSSPSQKSIPLDMAVVYWKLLLSSGGLNWTSKNTPWLEYWLEYVETKWTRGVNRDMWNMLYEFLIKTEEDETFSWWDEGGAWPSVLDEFVLFVKEKRGADGAMEVE